MFEKIVGRLNKEYVRLLKNTPKFKLTEGKAEQIPAKSGIYVFYLRNKPFYIGQSVDIHRRINHQHLSSRASVAGSSFRARLLSKGYVAGLSRARKWIMSHCSLKYVLTKDRDDARLLEALLIRLWRNKYDLINDKGRDGV